MSVAVHAFSDGEGAGQRLARALDVRFALVRVHRFPDGEVLPTTPPPARTTIVYRSLDQPNDKLVELVLAVEAWRRLGAERLVLVAPYLAYMRQDSAFLSGQAISQRAVAGLLSSCFDRVITVNAHLHRTRLMGELFTRIPAESLSAAASLGDWLAAAGTPRDAVVLGPDEESAPLARAAAERLGAAWQVFAKVRHGDRAVELTLQAPGDLAGRPVVLVDDICSTGATLIAAVQKSRDMGAASVSVAVVHALFDARVEARLRAAGAGDIISTDSVLHPTNRVGLAPLLAGALQGETIQ
jgi:ribose-phosphate pyrophosphokinase